MRLGNGGDLGVGGIEAGVRLKEDLDDGLAVDGCRFDVLDVVDSCRENPLIHGSQTAFHLLGVQTGVGPGDGDHGDIDIRKDVGRGARDDDRAGDKNQQRQNDKGVGAIRERFGQSTYRVFNSRQNQWKRRSLPTGSVQLHARRAPRGSISERRDQAGDAAGGLPASTICRIARAALTGSPG